MTPQERKAALILQNVTAAQIARELGVARATVSAVLGGFRRQRRVEDKIAAVIGKPVEQVFEYRQKIKMAG